jgi:hypothetical protein
MVEPVATRLDPTELKRLLKAADPGAILVPPRILRRIIKRDRRLTGIGLQVPHRKTYVIDREALFKITDKKELGLEPERGLPRTVILITRPDPERLAVQSRGEALLKYWRLLFHARVHVALEQRLAARLLTRASVHARIQRIGQTEFDEIRGVLRQENFLLPPHEDRTVYTEFAALYLELRYFAPALVPRYFPSLRDRTDLEQILTEDLSARRIFAETWLEGAPDPVTAADGVDREDARGPDLSEPAATVPGYSTDDVQALLGRARAAAAGGNAVRAAILCERVAQASQPEQAAAARAAARTEVNRLADRLGVALDLDEPATEAWRQALPALLPRAARRIWPVEARLLYDLQKACVDHERDVYALDLVEWFLSLGSRPVKRHLPHHRAVLMAKHCRSAAARLPTIRLAESDRQAVARLLHQAVSRTEERLRDQLRPPLATALEQVGLCPGNFPERVARDKLVEELLDLVVERGYLTMGDLRDAVSRNNLKLPDLSGPDEFFLGDRLIRTNRRLAVALDGVYRRGEIYLRWLQRLSSVVFGTRVGRFLTRYLILPFGVAFVTIEGSLHLVNPFLKLAHHHKVELSHATMMTSVVLLGAFLFGLLHVESFRKQVVQGLRLAAGLVRGLVVDLPNALLTLPIVRRLRASRPYQLCRDFVVKPALITAVISVVFPLYGVSSQHAWIGRLFIFAGVSLLLHSRLGRTIEEAVTDAVVRTWLRFRLDLFPALFTFTMGLFKGLLEAVERGLYAVDEWLRFRSGQGRLTLVVKTVLGFAWFFVTYFVRIYLNLFVEPTFNPIKHFPVVTVSAKLLVPFIPFLITAFEAPFLPLGQVFAKTMAGINVALLPGIFGFLVWELTANWRLYLANRPRGLRPVVVGHHGETLARLLKPGFHSGTVPKLYAKLRRAERQAHRSGNWKASRKYRQALHHVEERVRHFVEREFLALLHGSQCWGAAPVRVGKIHLGSNRIAIELTLAGAADASAWVAFEERAGWLGAAVVNPGWFVRLAARERGALTTALAGLYKMGSVELVREQLEASFEPGTVAFDILEEGLVVWPSTGYEVQAVYHLRDGEVLKPCCAPGAVATGLPTLSAARLLFTRTVIPWARWVEVWEADQAGKAHPERLLAGVNLLPLPEAGSGR